MALVWQMHKLIVKLPNFSSCYSKFIKSNIYIFETSIEYIFCEIISSNDIVSDAIVRYKRLV